MRYIFTFARRLDTVEANDLEEALKYLRMSNPDINIEDTFVLERRRNPNYEPPQPKIKYPYEICLACGKQHRKHSKAWEKCRPKREALEAAKERA